MNQCPDRTTVRGAERKEVMGSQCRRAKLSSPTAGNQWASTKEKRRNTNKITSAGHRNNYKGKHIEKVRPAFSRAQVREGE